ncbi:ATP-binding protein [Paenibacillus sp. CAU 1782]
MTLPSDHSGVTESDLRLDRLASVGQIAAGIAHEVKNPLTVVKGFLQLLKQEAPHKYLDYAFAELENAISTMENLLHVSKPDLESEPFDIIDLCSELDSVLHLFQERFYQVSIHKHFSDTDARIYGKRNPLKKALFNLLKNAFEAIPEDGAITVAHFRSDDKIVVSITDSGCGIPGDELDLLGTPFYTSKVNGTGIGLTQVFTTIYEHGGFIRVRSELGAGTEFSLHFPLWSTEYQSGDFPTTTRDGLHSAQSEFDKTGNACCSSHEAERNQPNCSTPVITLLDHVGLLPLAGGIQSHRGGKAHESVLAQINELKLNRLIIDFSAIDRMTEPTLCFLSEILEGAVLNKCAATLTGIRPELSDTLLEKGLVSRDQAASCLTLQQVLQGYIKPSNLLGTDDLTS